MAIYFFHPDAEYGFLSNFSNHSLEIAGEFWPTVEHYYQAQKFTNRSIQHEIRQAKTPDKAKRLAHKFGEHIRTDWERAKDEVMTYAVKKKFETHKELQNLLISTGDEELIEDSKSDFYWGCGWDRTGQNKLGKILMEIRKIGF